MSDVSLTPGRVVYAYQVDGPCFFQYEGRQVEAVEFYVESDFFHPHSFAVQIMTRDQHSIVYESHNHDTWPTVARRLYRQHTSALRQAGLHV